MTKIEEPSSARILAGLSSFICPGLGQLLLDRVWSGIQCFALALPLWFIGFYTISEGFSTASYILPMVGVVIVIIPNAVAAYFAANGHKTESAPQKTTQSKPAQPSQNFSIEEQGFDFHDYATYSAWCVQNEHEPMSPAQFEQTFGRKS